MIDLLLVSESFPQLKSIFLRRKFLKFSRNLEIAILKWYCLKKNKSKIRPMAVFLVH